jgi:hypothetical protein
VGSVLTEGDEGLSVESEGPDRTELPIRGASGSVLRELAMGSRSPITAQPGASNRDSSWSTAAWALPYPL